MQVSVLGPEGTYSSQAARLLEPAGKLVLAGSNSKVIDMVADGESQRGVVPIENSIEGVVTVSFDELFAHNLLVRGEEVLDIHHTLAGIQVPERPEDISRIYSHPQALAQCSRYFRRHYPGAEVVETGSTAAGLQIIAEREDETALAVGPDPAVDIYELTRVDTAIEDEDGNQTRFVAFSKETESDQELPFVMITVVPDDNRPGLVHDMTGVFKEYGINMSDFHSRPIRRQLGRYRFNMRLDMGSKDGRYEAVAAGIEAQGCQVVRMSVS